MYISKSPVAQYGAVHAFGLRKDVCRLGAVSNSMVKKASPAKTAKQYTAWRLAISAWHTIIPRKEFQRLGDCALRGIHPESPGPAISLVPHCSIHLAQTACMAVTTSSDKAISCTN